MATIEHLILGRARVNTGRHQSILDPGITEGLCFGTFPQAFTLIAHFVIVFPWSEVRDVAFVDDDGPVNVFAREFEGVLSNA